MPFNCEAFSDAIRFFCKVSHLRLNVPQAEAPAADAGEVIATGGIVGATLGGLALAATALTGGVAGAAAAVLIGGGAIAGGFGNLIVSKGYDDEADDHYKQAVERGWIVVGVEIRAVDGIGQVAEAEQILNEAGAKALEPV